MAADETGISHDLLLRVTPPRVPRHLIARSQLRADHPHFNAAAVVVQAPAGFGKTFLLAQWRRECLAQGAVVAWVSAQPGDDVPRFLHCLALSVRLAAARPTFGHTLLAGLSRSGLDGITVWLAEVAQSALQMVLMVDDAERLSDEARELLTYLLHNAPSNLRTVVGVRPDCQLAVADLLAYGDCVQVGLSALRFQLDETLALCQSRLPDRLDADTVARLYEWIEGWPLGLQLALTVIAASPDPRAEVAAMVSGANALQGNLMEQMWRYLDPGDLDCLTRVSILDQLHPGLCAALTQDPQIEQRLARMVRDTPVLVAAEHGRWWRLHALARKALLQRARALPQAEWQALHARASGWLAEQGQPELAARHALEAGQTDKAFDLAERSLYESLMTQGHQTQVLEWLDRMPEGEWLQRPRLLLAAAWSLALSERHIEAERLVARLMDKPGADSPLRCECALIMSGAAVFADQPDRFAALHDPWAQNPPLHDPLLRHVHANRTAYRTLLDGQPALARVRLQMVPSALDGQNLSYLEQWGELVVGLTYLWEGQVQLVDQLLRPVLARAEVDLGRRSPFASTLAALLAAAVWELDRPDEAITLLANRLDVLERHALPEAVLLAYRTLARAAVWQGQEHRALELLGALDALGVSRGLARLRLVSLCDQVRLHARRYRAESCRPLLAQMAALIEAERPARGPLWLRSAQALLDLARGYAGIAARQWREAFEPLAAAGAHAQAQQMGRFRIEILGLQAFVRDQCGERAQALLGEAVDLAQVFGLMRVFNDVHPDVGAWVARSLQTPQPPASPPPSPAPVRGIEPQARSQGSMALTPKEREVIELLNRNLSNKEIGLAMDVGEETIKWHLKNLFAKLDAGNRKQVVARARLFGLID